MASEGAEDAQSSLLSPASLLSLDHQCLLTILGLLRTPDAVAATSTCKSLHAVQAELWHLLLVERWSHVVARPDPASWGLPDSQCLLAAVEGFGGAWCEGYWLLLTDHPWCQLHVIRPARDAAGRYSMVGCAVHCRIRGRGDAATLELEEAACPTFRVAFRMDASGGGDGGGNGEGDGEDAAVGASEPRVTLLASILDRDASLSLVPPSSIEEIDYRAMADGTPYPDKLSLSYLSSLTQGQRVLRLSWTSAAEVPSTPDTLEPLRLAPPATVHWLANHLEGRARAEAQGQSQPIAGLTQRLRYVLHSTLHPRTAHDADGSEPAVRLSRPPGECAITLGRVPSFATDFSPPATWADHGFTLPLPGLYASDYGHMYAPRNVELVLIRTLRLTIDDPATVALRKSLFLSNEPDERLGSLTLVATKICGDIHVPAAATTFYIPLAHGPPAGGTLLGEDADSSAGGEGGGEGGDEGGGSEVVHASVEVMAAVVANAMGGGSAFWSGFGCLAYPGFGRPHFAPGRLRSLDTSKFTFGWTGDSDKVYHRLPTRENYPLPSSTPEDVATEGARADQRQEGETVPID